MRDVLWHGKEVWPFAGASHRIPGADWQAQGVAIDTRDLLAGDIFVALPGEKAHGHDYVAQAFQDGAAAALVGADFEAADLDKDAILLPVDNVLAALKAWRAQRKRSAAQIIAITGSVGKTGTKASLADALAKSGKTHAAERSFNNHIGVPLSLARLPQDAEYGVFELGMNHAGEIAALVDMVRPHCAIITTIAAAHIENFPSMEALAAAKAKFFQVSKAAVAPYCRLTMLILMRCEKRPRHRRSILSASRRKGVTAPIIASIAPDFTPLALRHSDDGRAARDLQNRCAGHSFGGQ